MSGPVAIYRAIMLELERRRIAIGFPMEKFSEYAGLPDRYFSKALHADQPSGRQAQWATVQTIADALFPAGFDLEIKARPGAPLDFDSLKARLLQLRATTDPKSQRELMREIGRKGGRRSALTRMKSVSKARRKAIARNAAQARWSMPQITEITPKKTPKGT